ncbi:hypothetical protein [Nostoc sp. FACHB-133]|uniref:hypothetical protein n=1 Tax=Nostoc sp. FACHB-133 TaxID=2692835 RepID=UPI0016825033|nr:hypothetical protein [Nostoc sp. FACHB-133]MBD2523465.1 hypothetical protein [Nostoc sp. FACHB-133]
MKAKPQIFLVVEDHPEVAQNNCDFLIKFRPLCYLCDRQHSPRSTTTSPNRDTRFNCSRFTRAVQNYIQHLKVKLGIGEVERKDINSRIALCMKAIQRKLLSF